MLKKKNISEQDSAGKRGRRREREHFLGVRRRQQRWEPNEWLRRSPTFISGSSCKNWFEPINKEMTGACVIPRLKKKLLAPSLAPSPARSRPLGPAKSLLGQSVRHPFPKRMREQILERLPRAGINKGTKERSEPCPESGQAPWQRARTKAEHLVPDVGNIPARERERSPLMLGSLSAASRLPAAFP